ncbi:MAG: hypothetical protein ACI97A_002369 [Planctomycetota bacterium]
MSEICISSAAIAVVQTTKDRLSADFTLTSDLAKFRRVAVERQVPLGVIVILNIFFEDAE